MTYEICLFSQNGTSFYKDAILFESLMRLFIFYGRNYGLGVMMINTFCHFVFL